jgi:predicted permease
MGWTRRWRKRLRALVRKGEVERELDDELAFHLQLETERNIAAGMAPEDARRQAMIAFGGLERTKEEVRDSRGFGRLDAGLRDVRYALRGLQRAPGFALATVLTLALGVGAPTAVFTLVNSILLQPLPYPESDRLVALKHSAPGLGLDEVGLSTGTYLHYRTEARSLESVALYRETVQNLSMEGEPPERIELTYAGPELFRLLRVRPALGRLYTEEEWAPVVAVSNRSDLNRQIPVLLSHDLWRRRFGGDPAIIGTILTINGAPREVVGVLPEGFAFPRPETQVWMLYVVTPPWVDFASDFGYAAVGRLAQGVTPAAAGGELRRVLPSIEGLSRDATADRIAEARLEPIVVPLKHEITGGAASLLWVLFGGMGLLLLVASVNVANLFLARSEHRTREMAVRTALGARRGQLLRLFLSESVVLAAIGAALGILLAAWSVKLLIAFAPVALPRMHEVRLGWTAVAFAVGMSLVAAGAFASLSLRRHSRSAPIGTVLKTGNAAASAGRRQRRLSNALVAAQVALALTLLAGSALMVRTFWSLTHVNRGFDAGGVLAVDISFPYSRTKPYEKMYAEVLEEVRALPGVRTAAAASFLPLAGSADRSPVQPAEPGSAVSGMESPIALKFITADYFETMRTPVLEGPHFGVGESIDQPSPVWVSRSLARRLFPGASPIGRQIQRLHLDSPLPPFTIAGVVGDTREETLRRGGTEILYIPITEPRVEPVIVSLSGTLVVRTDAAPLSLVAAMRNRIREVDPTATVARIRTMDAIVSASIAKESFVAVLLLISAITSLFLGAIGTYGVVAYAVRRRTQEIGIRRALGADAREVVAMVMRESLTVVIFGACAGLLVTVAAARGLRSLLFEVQPTDPITIITVLVIVVAVALLASLIPARRAASVDPTIALRGE